MIRTLVHACSLVFLGCVGPEGLHAAEAGISVSWKSLSLGDLSRSETMSDISLKDGPVEVELKSPRFITQVVGFEIAKGKLSFQMGKFEFRFDEVRGQNVLITDVPHITVRTVRKEKVVFGKRIAYDEPVTETKMEKKRIETVLFTLKDVALIAEKKEGAELGLNLPAEVSMELTQNSLHFLDVRSLVTSLQTSIDESFSDGVLNESLTLRLENVPKIVESVARGQKPSLYAALRDALKREVQKPEFVEKLEAALTHKLPLLDAPGTHFARATFRCDGHGYSNITIGSLPIEIPTSSPDLFSVTNTEGFNLLVRSLFSGIAQGKIQAPWSGRLSYTPSARDAIQLADIVTQMSGTAVDGSNVDSLAIALVGAEATLSEKNIGLKVTLVLTLKSGDPLRFPAHFDFAVDEAGALVLSRIHAETTDKSLRGNGFPLFRKLQNEVKLMAATLLLNQQLANFQKGQTGTPKTRFELMPGTEPALRIYLNR